MKFPSILGFLVIFSLVMFSGISIFNGTAQEYNIDTTNNSYSSVEEYYTQTNDLYSDISGTSSASSNSNFLTDLASIWRISTSFFSDSITLAQNFKTQLANDLKINPIILDSIMILVIIGFTALLVSIAVRWKVDN